MPPTLRSPRPAVGRKKADREITEEEASPFQSGRDRKESLMKRREGQKASMRGSAGGRLVRDGLALLPATATPSGGGEAEKRRRV